MSSSLQLGKSGGTKSQFGFVSSVSVINIDDSFLSWKSLNLSTYGQETMSAAPEKHPIVSVEYGAV